MGPIASWLGGKAMLCQIIIAILWVPTYVPANPIELEGDGVPGDNKTCIAPECRKMSRMMRRQMGNDTPCKDFHDYVCGNWAGDRELKSAVLKKKAVITLAGLLKNASESSQVSNATNALIRAYQSCTKMGKNEEALKISIGKVLAAYNVTNKTWPLIDDIEVQTARKESDAYLEVLKKTGPRPVFSYFVSMQNGTPFILMTKPSEFYVFEDEESYDYANYTDLVAEDEKAYKKFIKQTIKLLNALYSREEVKTAAEDIVRMERGFSKLASAAKDEGPQKMNLSQLSQVLGKAFPMTEILKKDFEGLNIDINEGTPVLVKYIDYFKEAVAFMKCNTMESLSNYIMWTIIRKIAKAEGTLLHKFFLRFKGNSTSFDLSDLEDSYKESADGTKKLHLLCMRQLLQNNIMYTAGASYYVNTAFNQTSKEDVLKLMTFINSSFMHIVEKNTWMTDQTRKAAIMVLEKTNPIIGYPDWMLNETIIAIFYEFVPVISGMASFVEHYHYLGENDHKQTLRTLDPQKYFTKTNEDVALRSHAYYDETTATLAYPAAALVTHYRRPPIPRSVNFGTIGTIFAQLLTNIIDRYNYAFNGTQRYNNDTWDNETIVNFCKRSSCLNNTEECNDTIKPSSDKHQKLRDYLGMRISYQAMLGSKKNYSPPFLLPDKNGKFNSESKIFFTLFGSLYCPYSVYEKPVNKEPVESRADDEEKFPDSLNEIVYTYKEFNTTFNCTETKGANTCRLTQEDEPTPPFGC